MNKSDAALVELYDKLRARNAPKPGSFSSLDDAGRREYFRSARKRNRAVERAVASAGSRKPTVANIRAALADAALMILAVDAPGAEQVRSVLATAFSTRAGVALSVETRAKAGKLRPKVVT